MRIGVDIDGVVANTHMAMLDSFKSKGFAPPETTLDQWVQFACWNIWPEASKEECRELFRSAAFWESVPPIKYAIPSLSRMRQCGHYVYLVTARGSSQGMCDGMSQVEMATREWLTAYGVSYDGLIFDPDKAKVAAEYKLECFYEDTLVNAVQLASVCRQVYLMDGPWNQCEELPDNVMRTTWRDTGWWRR